MLRRTARQTARTIFFWLLVSPFTPAAADEIGDAIAAVNRAMVGSWTGETRSLEPESDAEADAFSFAVTTDDGTGYAFWRPDGLTLSDYRGDGVYRQRSWDQDGQLREAFVSTSDVVPPDADGRWSLVETEISVDTDGVEREARTRYVFDGGVLTSLGEERPAGSGEPYRARSAGEWTLIR